jgi:hypothetical protein
MNSLPISAALILKTIRDGSSVDHAALDRLAPSPTQRGVIRHTLGALQSADLIQFDSGHFKVTNRWMNLQGLLGISLTTLIDVQPGATSLSVSPMFGAPGNPGAPEVFVLMSFDEKYRPVYEDHIKTVASGLSLTAGRADDFFTAHAVIGDIWGAIYHSRMVIADCTGRNANVFYEIGMAHTIGKPVILITQNEADVPFDLRPIRYIHYTYTPPGMKVFEERLGKTITSLLKDSTASRGSGPARMAEAERMAKHIINYAKAHGFTKVSFEKIRENVNTQYTDEALLELIDKSPDKFRRARLSGGRPGIGLLQE